MNQDFKTFTERRKHKYQEDLEFVLIAIAAIIFEKIVAQTS